ncbi:hypothetical protein ACQZ19_09360 [Rahnella variigena]|uniref:hypothetical protein n=1 Tax=Rahnella variigena TaxID=574964 RepID=UPI003D2DC095
MPVNLDVIPDKAPGIFRPRTRRWLLFLPFMLLAGATSTLWFWKNEHTGIAFWFTAIGLPAATWGILFSLRRIGYKCDQIWATSWNREREQLIEEETLRGQRYICWHGGVSFTTVGKSTEKLLSAVLKNTPLMSSVIPRTGGFTVRHTRLGSTTNTIPGVLQEWHGHLKQRISALLDTLPAGMPCYILLDVYIDQDPQVNAKHAQEVMAMFSRPLRQINGEGFAALDQWIDMTWGIPSALLVIGTQINNRPEVNSGEAATAMLLTNCPMPDERKTVRIHRPECGTNATLTKTLSRALLWANVQPASVGQAWLTGGALLTDSEWSTACEKNALGLDIQKQCSVIDNITGFTGCTAPWLALLMAATQCREDGITQAVAVQTATDKIWVGCVSAPASNIKDIQDTSL